jgi:hypothetical protein
MAPHYASVPVFDGVQPVDVIGPCEVLAAATASLRHRDQSFGPESDYAVSLIGGTAPGSPR